jgi:hypothetical protein
VVTARTGALVEDAAVPVAAVVPGADDVDRDRSSPAEPQAPATSNTPTTIEGDRRTDGIQARDLHAPPRRGYNGDVLRQVHEVLDPVLTPVTVPVRTRTRTRPPRDRRCS